MASTSQGDLMEDKYTLRQGQYLAFIYYYTKIHGHAPSEAELEQHFKVAWSSVSIIEDTHIRG